MRSLDDVFVAFARSPFRRRFRLQERERAYLRDRGLPTVLEHARGFVAARLAPARPANDGRQTAFRGHPVFVAHHATACCCRGCLQKWHCIPRGHELTATEREYVVAALEQWLRQQAGAEGRK
jgi:uncharacterized protein DUF4186